MMPSPSEHTLAIIDKIDAVARRDFCSCGKTLCEHTYWEDRIYDVNGYRCPGGIGGEFRFDVALTDARHKEARANELEAALAGVATPIGVIEQQMRRFTEATMAPYSDERADMRPREIGRIVLAWADALANVQASICGAAIP